jgi:membrane-associated phospholipid phosphatase
MTTARLPSAGHRPGLAADLVRQAVLVALAALAYFGVRGLTQGGIGTALDNAARVVGAERALGAAWEDEIQDAVLGHDTLVALANWVYIYGHWPVVIGVLVWLFARHPDRYRDTRDALFISGAIGLVIFMAFPTAPPRLAEMGLIDTVTERSSSYRALQPPGLLNKYAAMPSLHFGWNLLVGLAMFREARRLPARIAALVVPALMAIAVVATANHWVLDVVAGGMVALGGALLVRPVRRVIATLPGRRR